MRCVTGQRQTWCRCRYDAAWRMALTYGPPAQRGDEVLVEAVQGDVDLPLGRE